MMLVGVINIVALLTYVYMYVHVYVYMTIDTPFSVCAMLLWYEECCKSVFLLVWGRSMQSNDNRYSLFCVCHAIVV